MSRDTPISVAAAMTRSTTDVQPTRRRRRRLASLKRASASGPGARVGTGEVSVKVAPSLSLSLAPDDHKPTLTSTMLKVNNVDIDPGTRFPPDGQPGPPSASASAKARAKVKTSPGQRAEM
jgi:hypothetical protein